MFHRAHFYASKYGKHNTCVCFLKILQIVHIKNTKSFKGLGDTGPKREQFGFGGGRAQV